MQPPALIKRAESHSESPLSQIAMTTVCDPVAATTARMNGGVEPGYEVTLFGGTMTRGLASHGVVAVNGLPSGSLAYAVLSTKMPTGSEDLSHS